MILKISIYYDTVIVVDNVLGMKAAMVFRGIMSIVPLTSFALAFTNNVKLCLLIITQVCKTR